MENCRAVCCVRTHHTGLQAFAAEPGQAGTEFRRRATLAVRRLLDAGTEAAAQPAPPPPPDDRTDRTGGFVAAPGQKSGQEPTKDGDAAKTANTDTTANTTDAANSDPTATGGKAVSSVKAKTDAKICEQTGDDTKLTGDKTAGDAKPADGLTPAVHTALLANNAASSGRPRRRARYRGRRPLRPRKRFPPRLYKAR